MPEPEDTLWRAAAAVARRRGVVTDVNVTVTEPRVSVWDFSPTAPMRYGGGREVEVTIRIRLESLDELSREPRVPVERLEEITQRAGIGPTAPVSPAVVRHDETLEAVRAAATGSTLAVHDVYCNVDRRRPRTPGMNGCSCESVPGSGMPSHATTPGPTASARAANDRAEAKVEEAMKRQGRELNQDPPMDDSSTRFSLLELDI